MGSSPDNIPEIQIVITPDDEVDAEISNGDIVGNNNFNNNNNNNNNNVEVDDDDDDDLDKIRPAVPSKLTRNKDRGKKAEFEENHSQQSGVKPQSPPPTPSRRSVFKTQVKSILQAQRAGSAFRRGNNNDNNNNNRSVVNFHGTNRHRKHR